ncbi:MAG: cation acetate symporter [Chloroflexi bacterium]|nr:MAG: cation acetate symporter [Chloroflexota bacterium]TME40162.1 MAG: cation acetate symporter [Chloroflexota bacterium]TME50243.1 MAG: cation acetate symporter [Chloroflexota bacterium]
MNLTLALFLIVIAITLGITAWASRRTGTTVQFWAAGRGIKGWQNGLAISGDYMSAASFLGIAGLIAFNGYDGFMYSVGWLVAYLTVLFLIAEPMRNTGKYTLADVLSYRMSPIPVRSAAAFSTVAVSASYMMAQMIGAGSLIKILIPSLDSTLKPWFNWTILGTKLDPSITVVGALMMIYVIAGGMVATTWVQIVKAVMLMGGAILLSFLVLLHFGFNFGSFFDAIAKVKAANGLNFTQPGILYPYGKTQVWGIDKALLENVSLGMALILGTAGLPHILMRFFTVPNAKAARQSVVWAMGLIGSFYIMTTFLGFGAATLVGKAKICAAVAPKCTPNSNLAAPRLAEYLGTNFFGTGGGEFLLAFIAAVAFATILAVVAGLTLAASGAFSHDFYVNVIRTHILHGHVSEREQVMVARITAGLVGLLSIWLAARVGATANAAALVAGVAFVIAAAANLPAILFTLFWKRFNTWGAVASLVGGSVMTIWLVSIGPGWTLPAVAHPAFPLQNVGIVSIPIGFALAILGTYLGELAKADRLAERKFHEIDVRAQTGIGAEPAAAAG